VRCCHLCGHAQGLVFGQESGLFFCRNLIACNYRSRLRLGIPRWQANRMRSDEKRGHL